MTATAQRSTRRHLSAADTLETLRNPTIARLVTATFLNSAGNIVYNVGVAWLAYQLTSSSLVVGSLNGVRTLPVLLLGPFVGLLLDRFYRPTVVKLNAAYTALLAAAFLALVLAGEVQVWHLYAYMLLVGVGFAVGVPARRSVYADTVDRGLLLNALSLDLLAFEVVRIGAPAAAGLAIATLGIGAAFGGQLVLYSAALLALLPLTGRRLDTSQVATQSPLRNLRDGLAYAAGQPVVATNLLLGLAVFLVGPDVVFFLLPVYVRDTLHLGAEGVGFLGSASALGGVLAGLLVPGLAKRWGHRVLLPGALVLMGLAMAGLALATTVVAAVPLAFSMGMGLISFRALSEAAIQRTIDPAYRGRVGTLSFVMMGSGAVAGLVAGWLSSLAGAPAAIATGGLVLLAVAGLAAWRADALQQMEEEPCEQH